MIAAALEEIDLSAVLAALREQEEKHGHTAESDAELPLEHFAADNIKRSIEAADVARRGDRQNLAAAHRRYARLAALCISTMRRIRVEQQQRSTDHYG